MASPKNTPVGGTPAATQRADAVVRFAGDSGDGMQVIGDLFCDESAMMGLGICTFPDYPAEIRAPKGTLSGVSGYQVHFGATVETPGDIVDALVVMNPAALKVNLDALDRQGLLIADLGAFTPDNLKKAGYETSPLDDPGLRERYKIISYDFTELTKETLKNFTTIKTTDKLRSKNFFTLGLVCWIYSYQLDATIEWIEGKWAGKGELAPANIAALKAGYNLGLTAELTMPRYTVARSMNENGVYRKINGNDALCLGLIAGSQNCFRDIVIGGYPITPATSILEFLSAQKNFNVKAVQAEDEIAAIGVALGASYAGSLGVTATSGPGVCLKSEILNLAVMTELPLILIDVQRAGPSTGLPTKTEQTDLLQAMFGRNGDSPMPILAPASPSDCFDIAIEAVRIAIKWRTPVFILSDGYLAHSSEVWKIPRVEDIPDLSVEPIRHGETYVPYQRDPVTLARRIAIPGRPGFEHRIGGLEKNEQGKVDYSGSNHEKMVHLRHDKIETIAETIPPLTVEGAQEGDLLVLGWGSTRGAIHLAARRVMDDGKKIGVAHLRHLNPLPKNMGEVLRRYKRVLLPELNLGQLALLLRAKYLVDIQSFNSMQGRNFTVSEVEQKIREMLP